MTPAFLQPVSHTFHLTLGRWNYVLYSRIRLTKRVTLENVKSKLCGTWSFCLGLLKHCLKVGSSAVCCEKPKPRGEAAEEMKPHFPSKLLSPSQYLVLVQRRRFMVALFSGSFRRPKSHLVYMTTQTPRERTRIEPNRPQSHERLWIGVSRYCARLVSSAAVGFLSVTPLLGFEELI